MRLIIGLICILLWFTGFAAAQVAKAQTENLGIERWRELIDELPPRSGYPTNMVPGLQSSENYNAAPPAAREIVQENREWFSGNCEAYPAHVLASGDSIDWQFRVGFEPSGALSLYWWASNQPKWGKTVWGLDRVEIEAIESEVNGECATVVLRCNGFCDVSYSDIDEAYHGSDAVYVHGALDDETDLDEFRSAVVGVVTSYGAHELTVEDDSQSPSGSSLDAAIAEQELEEEEIEETFCHLERVSFREFPERGGELTVKEIGGESCWVAVCHAVPDWIENRPGKPTCTVLPIPANQEMTFGDPGFQLVGMSPDYGGTKVEAIRLCRIIAQRSGGTSHCE